MIIRFLDNKGTQDTLYFNPQVIFYTDGSIIMLPSIAYLNGFAYRLPLYAGQVKELWVDIKESIYDENPSKLSPGAFKAIWVSDGCLKILRYKEEIAKKPLLIRIKEFMYAIITQFRK